jgi:RNA polymerase sigma-B factor
LPDKDRRSRRTGPVGKSSAPRDLVRQTGSDELFELHQRTGDPLVREELVRRYEPLARNLARRYHSKGESLDDLRQVANVGLLKAIAKFDPERGFAFTSYATPTILGELKRHFRDSGWALHVPRGAKERALELASVSEELSSRLGRSPSIGELAQELELSEEQTLDALEAYHARRVSPLEERTDDEGQPRRSRADSLGAEDAGLERSEYMTMITKGIEGLPESERMILFLRFAQDLTQSEIAIRVGVSQMQVSRLLRGAIEKLRAASGEEDPDTGSV